MECPARLDNRIAGNGAMSTETRQLISYIAPAAPATRQPVMGDEPFLRPEIGFTPNWFRTTTGINFGRKWHCEPAYRLKMLPIMLNEIKRRFPRTSIGGIDNPEKPPDLLTGTYGCVSIAAIYKIPIVYAEDNWPKSERSYLNDNEIDNLEPPNLERNPFFQELMAQVDWIASNEGKVEGYINFHNIGYFSYKSVEDLREGESITFKGVTFTSLRLNRTYTGCAVSFIKFTFPDGLSEVIQVTICPTLFEPLVYFTNHTNPKAGIMKSSGHSPIIKGLHLLVED